MSAVLSFLSNVKLTVSQWLLLLGAAMIGVLVAALKLQGSRLHAAQVSLLTDHLNNTQAQYDQKVQTAKDRFNAALEAYNATK